MIYHVVRRNDWEKWQQDDVYWPESVDKEGFIHCSTKEQMISIGNDLFPEEKELLLLKINSKEVESLVVLEDLSESGIMFPHIYGHLNLDAIKSVKEIRRNEDGVFNFIDHLE
ncbi:DUF952 domain-containing protein [Evansella sp. AB-P1]|uniref:DUF952 domain-containing protein n=1 Tax=Evansella sp. AB-P1 TaxID=3037653 RepID=UPI00241D6F44|nr:DUF952 domain-containing protein [Evansella sp. AB-P1]MDG5789674.1 DUF952 domain-containing protein [Evansella sp. AB-P1]